MPLFRFHRGSLCDSLETTIIVMDEHDLAQKIYLNAKDWMPEEFSYKNIVIKIRPYGELDVRIGWYTQIVLANLYDNETFVVAGFLSEPF